MTFATRHRLSGLAILAAGGLLTWVIVGISFDPLFVTGGTAPAIISGAGLGKPAALGVAVVLLAAAAWLSGKARFVLLLLWLVFLASATHRLVEFADGSVTDVWLALPVQRLAAVPPEAEERRCQIGKWLARCYDGSGHALISPSPLPLVPLYPGLWTV